MSCVTIFRATASLWEVQHHRDSWTLMLPCWVSNGVIRDVVRDIAWPFFRARHSLPGWANSGTARRVWTSEGGRHQGFGLHTSERTSMKILWVDLLIWCLFFSPVDGWRWWILYDFVGLMILVCLLMHTCYHVSMVRDGSGGWVWWCHVGCHAWPFFRESMWINWNHIFVIFCVVLGVHHCTDCPSLHWLPGWSGSRTAKWIWASEGGRGDGWEHIQTMSNQCCEWCISCQGWMASDISCQK